MMRSMLLFVALLASSFTLSSAVCAGGGYDVSVAERDLFFNTTDYEWWLHPCGSVSATSDPVCGNSTLFPFGSMLCQRPHGASSAYNLAIYNQSTRVTWLETAAHNGVEYRMQDGDSCGSFRREATIRFLCDQTATTPTIFSVNEVETCWYTVVVKTSAACSAIGATGSNSVGSARWSTQCGAGVYDLSSISSSDLVWQDTSYIWYIRLCGTVSNTACSAAQPTSFCQQPKSSVSTPVDVSHYNISQAALWTITDNGMRVELQDGAVCSAIGAGVPRQATYELICNPYITVPFVAYVTEIETCHYTVVIQTPAVCSGSNAPQMGYCGGAGSDFSLINADFRLRSGNYDWYIHPCGVLSPYTTTACGPTASACQVTINATTGNTLAIWNQTVAHEAVTWVALPSQYSVSYSLQDGGLCGAIGNVPREMTVKFVCDTNARIPVFDSISEVETCWYTAVIKTWLACYAQVPVDRNAIGYTYTDAVCGGERYDFSNIRAQGDLVLDTNTSSTTTGWMFAIDLCGRVQNTRCSSVQPTSFCQYGKGTSTSVYSLSYMGANQQATYTVNANGITMTYADGQGCGGIPSRVAIIQVICDGTTPARLDSVREIETCHYQAVVRATCNPGSTVPLPESSSSSSSSTGSAVVPIPIQAPTVTQCAGAGYSLIDVAQSEYTYNDGAYNWYFRPCAVVSYAVSPVCGNAANFPFGSMLCQQPINQTYAYNVAVYNASTSLTWVAIPGGVSYSIQDGDFCGASNFRREVTVKFMCDASATTARIDSVVEVELCWYTVTMRTNRACNPIGPTGSNQVGSSFLSAQCGAGVYDLTTLSSADLMWRDSDYDWTVRMCGQVTNPNCTSVQPTSMCQFDRGTGVYDASHWNASDPALWTITSTGITAKIQDGTACTAVGANARRQTTFDIRCNPYITVPYISRIWEIETCHYTAVIQTPAVCTGSNGPVNGLCAGAGYDMSAVDFDFTITADSWNWYVRPCGPLSPFTTTACGPQASVCQQSVATPTTAYAIALWNSSVAQSVTWLAIKGGVQYQVQDGQLCAANLNSYRELTVKFMCDMTAGTPVLVSVIETETCWYTATFRTSAACYQQAPVDRNAIGYTYTDTVCGGERYDFSNIGRLGDLVFDSNSTSTDNGYRYYLDLCGTVSEPRCSTVQPTMFCQVGKPAATTTVINSLAYVNASTEVTYTLNSNGLTMLIQDGTPCGGIPNRVSSIQIVCDGTNPPRLDSVREVEVCHYSAVLRAQCNAGTSTQPWSSTGSNGGGSGGTGSNPPGGNTGSSGVVVPVDSSSSSSSLSGGAIAGIVIGVIVGVAILLLVLFFVCCSQSRGNKKSSNGEAGGAGRFDTFEESHADADREVEMGEVSHTED